jgi:ribonucleoside-triphosphate reductase
LPTGERLSSAEACRQLVRRALERFRIPYLTVTPTFSICPVHGYIAGSHEFCPVCDERDSDRSSPNDRQPCEVWTRVMGYHRPVSSFNTGKKGEFHERRCFRESVCEAR